VVSPLDDLVVGVDLVQVRAARRRVLVAGGAAKRTAVRAALAGGWLDTLITDLATAQHLAATPPHGVDTALGSGVDDHHRGGSGVRVVTLPSLA
jgi:hypothetical protein